MPEPLEISPSAIGTLESCPQKYLFNNAWGFRGGPAAAMSFGSVMHNTIKYFIGELAKGRALPFEEVERKFELEWTSAGFEDDYQEQEYKKDGLAQLRAFHASTLASPPEVIAQEKTFELPMENNVVLTGRMDQVNRLGPGEEEIVDYKTGRPRNEEKGQKRRAIERLCARGPRSIRLEPGQAHAAFPANESGRERHARRKEAQKSARGNSGSGRGHSRGRVSREAGLLRAGSATTNLSAPRGSKARRPALPAKNNAMVAGTACGGSTQGQLPLEAGGQIKKGGH